MDILEKIKYYKKNAYKLSKEDIHHIKKLVKMINKVSKSPGDKTTLKI